MNISQIKGKERWVPIVGFERRYLISNYGKVKSLPKWIKNRFSGYTQPVGILVGKKGHKGYIQYELRKNGKSKSLRRSRLVALHFIHNDDPVNKTQVNHINGIKDDDFFRNLEWCTQSENMLHSYKYLNRKAAYKGKFGKDHNQSIAVMAVKGEKKTKFESKTACGIALGVTVTAIWRAIKNNYPCMGYTLIEIRK